MTHRSLPTVHGVVRLPVPAGDHRRHVSPRQIVEHGQLCRADLGFDDDIFDLWWAASATHDLAALPVVVS